MKQLFGTLHSYAMWDRGVLSKYSDIEDLKSRLSTGIRRPSSLQATWTFDLNPRPVVWLIGWEGHYTECLACVKLEPCHRCIKFEDENCPICKGLGQVERGSGGIAIVDKEEWEYKRYIRMKRQIHNRFWRTAHRIGEVRHCRQCVGRGTIPIGKVFAASFPRRIEVKGTYFAVVDMDTSGAEESMEMTILEAERRKMKIAQVVGGVILLDETFSYQAPFFRTWKRWAPAKDEIAVAERHEILEGVA